MKKRLIAIATLAALPAISFAGGATVSGFADITYTNDNDISAFGAAAEIDVENKLSDKVSVRVDTDLSLTGNGATSSTLDEDGNPTGTSTSAATIEQAFFAFAAHEKVTVLGGVFNNPIGLEKEDAPDMPAISKGQIWGILDGQTALYGNNVAGVAAAAAVGPATITLGVLNDIGNADNEKNSFALVANVTPVKGLDLELGYVTQEDTDATPTAGNVVDFNAVYSIAGATVSLDYLAGENVVDSAVEVGLGYAVTDKIGVYARYDVVDYNKDYMNDKKDTTTTTLYASYQLASNLLVAAEYHIADDGNDDDAMAGLEFIATF